MYSTDGCAGEASLGGSLAHLHTSVNHVRLVQWFSTPHPIEVRSRRFDSSSDLHIQWFVEYARKTLRSAKLILHELANVGIWTDVESFHLTQISDNSHTMCKHDAMRVFHYYRSINYLQSPQAITELKQVFSLPSIM